jgi:hypothetical protein
MFEHFFSIIELREKTALLDLFLWKLKINELFSINAESLKENRSRKRARIDESMSTHDGSDYDAKSHFINSKVDPLNTIVFFMRHK